MLSRLGCGEGGPRGVLVGGPSVREVTGNLRRARRCEARAGPTNLAFGSGARPQAQALAAYNPSAHVDPTHSR